MSNPESVREESREMVRSLLRKLKANPEDHDSFQQLFEIYYPRVRGTLPHRVPAEEREDLIQEVFLRVYRGLGKCPDDVEDFERWLTTVTFNAYKNWVQSRLRLKRRGTEVPLPGPSSEGEIRGPEIRDPSEPPQGMALEKLLENERSRLLHRAIGEMPEQMRACVLLRVGQDRTYREIALILGLAEGTVKAHLHRARMWLRNVLGPYLEGFDL